MTVWSYFIIGLAWGFVFELLDDSLGEKVLGPTDIGVRFCLIVLWPITMIIFVLAYLSNFNK